MDIEEKRKFEHKINLVISVCAHRDGYRESRFPNVCHLLFFVCPQSFLLSIGAKCPSWSWSAAPCVKGDVEHHSAKHCENPALEKRALVVLSDPLNILFVERPGAG